MRLYDGWRSEIADAVREGQRAGAFRGDADPEAFARGYAAAADGLATHVVLHRGVVSPDDMRTACAALVDALAALTDARSTAAAAARSDPAAARRVYRRTPGSAG